MKYGIEAPWYQDDTERLAFNLYARHITELESIAKRIISGDITIDNFDLTIEDRKYVEEYMEGLR